MKQRERSAGIGAALASAGLRVLLVASGLAGVACAPTFDWREARLAGGDTTLMFPCRPDRHERMVRVGSATLRMQLDSCNAGKATFSLAVAEAGDAAQVGALLAALRRQAIANVSGTAIELALPTIAGATPNGQSARLRIVGVRPDGRRVVAHAMFFVKGLTLHQATVLDADPPVGADVLDTFFASIRV